MHLRLLDVYKGQPLHLEQQLQPSINMGGGKSTPPPTIGGYMGLKIKEVKGGAMRYSLVPEVIENEQAVKDEMIRRKNEQLHNDGWSKDRSKRYIGSIPIELYWNIPMMAGVSTKEGVASYWTNKKNVNKFFKEFDTFRAVSKL